MRADGRSLVLHLRPALELDDRQFAVLTRQNPDMRANPAEQGTEMTGTTAEGGGAGEAGARAGARSPRSSSGRTGILAAFPRLRANGRCCRYGMLDEAAVKSSDGEQDEHYTNNNRR